MTRDAMGPNKKTRKFRSGYASVNGLEMYYEIHGTGQPLVLFLDAPVK